MKKMGIKTKIGLIIIIFVLIFSVPYFSFYYFSGKEGRLKLEIVDFSPIQLYNNTSVEMSIALVLKNIGDTWVRIVPFPEYLNIFFIYPNGSGPNDILCTNDREHCRGDSGASCPLDSDLLYIGPNVKLTYHVKQIVNFNIIGEYQIYGYFQSFYSCDGNLPTWEGLLESNRITFEVK